MKNVPMAHHQYLCVPDGNGGMKCGGQDQRGEKPTDPLWSPGKPSNDTFSGDLCKKVVDDNKCIELCVSRALDGPRPTYGIPLGTDCQEWAEQTVNTCKFQCSSNEVTDKPFIGYPRAARRRQ
jgi:hypothetical protein